MAFHPDEAIQQPRVLELRVHGVNNTPPHAMLDLPEQNVLQVQGDDLGSFWRRNPDTTPPGPSERGHTPDSVEREAYSWGRLARLSIGGGEGVVGTILSIGTRMLWTLLLPFALVNVAYWSRRLHYGAAARPGQQPRGDEPFEPLRSGAGRGLSHSGGAWIFRVAGLSFTLLIVATAMVATVDLVAIQCQPRPGATTTACAFIPDFIRFIDGWSMGARIALVSIVPVLLMLGLYALSSRTRARFELASRIQRSHPGHSGDEAVADSATSREPRWPLLSTPGFWDHSPVSGPAANLHLAAGMTLVAGLSAWHLAAHGVATFPLTHTPVSPIFRALSVLCALLLCYQLYVQSRLDPLSVDVACPDDARSRRLREQVTASSTLHLILATATYAAVALLAASFGARDAVPAGRPQPMEGISVTVSVLVSVATLLVIIAMGVRRASANRAHRLRGSVVMGLVGLPIVGTLALLPLRPAYTLPWQFAQQHPALTASGIAAVTAVACVLARRWSRGPTTPMSGSTVSEARATGWGGRAPGVFLAIGLFLALIVSSALVLVVGDRLNGDNSAGSLLDLSATRPPDAGPAPPGDASDLVVPQLYGWFATAAALGLLVLGLIVGVIALARWKHFEDAVWPAGARLSSAQGEPGLRTLPGGPRAPGTITEPIARRVLRTRSSVRLAHRAEPMLGLMLACVLGAWLAVIVARQVPVVVVRGYWPGIVTAATALVSLVVIGVLAGGGTTASNRAVRPLGILWDLSCAVPRAAHPLGPPCYGERVVPEVLSRCRWWLSHDGTDTADPTTALSRSERSVVLSAHSLGGVICVAAILGAPWDGDEPPDSRGELGDWMVPRLGLITYGTQLRAYFSRFFPELYGPRVLGVAPALRSRLLAADPWETDWLGSTEPYAPPTPTPGSVRHLLSVGSDGTEGSRPRWFSLWHLTDYLGFPLLGRPTRALAGSAASPAIAHRDWYAQEVDYTAYLLTVLTHGDYPRTDEYVAALDVLVDELAPAPRQEDDA